MSRIRGQSIPHVAAIDATASYSDNRHKSSSYFYICCSAGSSTESATGTTGRVAWHADDAERRREASAHAGACGNRSSFAANRRSGQDRDEGFQEWTRWRQGAAPSRSRLRFEETL